MGIFKTVAKITDPGDFFGARSSEKAAKDAKSLGEQTLASQAEWMDYMKAQNEPFSESALRALPVQEAMVGIGGIDAQQAEVDNIMASPFYSQLVDVGENAIARNAQATGGFRTGTNQENLAKNEQEVLRGLWDQKLQNLGSLSTRGMNSQSMMQQGGSQSLDQMASTMSGIGNIGISSAANQQNKAMGIAGMAASIFSDERLKTNINKIGDKDGLPLYEWEWNETAMEKFGLEGKHEGHMVSDVEFEYPEAVGEQDGYKTVNYEMIGRSAA